MRLPVLIVVFGAALPAQTAAIQAALAAGSYLPLDVGDRWVYCIDDRSLTLYQT